MIQVGFEEKIYLKLRNGELIFVGRKENQIGVFIFYLLRFALLTSKEKKEQHINIIYLRGKNSPNPDHNSLSFP